MSARKIAKSKFFFEEDMIESIGEVSDAKREAWDKDTDLKVVGQPVPRLDGYDKVSGSAVYTFDKTLPNMAHARTLRSPHPHAKIIKIDTSKAKALPGVLAIISSENNPDVPWYYGISRLFDRHVRYAGDEVACVAAETEQIANKALALIDVTYETLPHVVDAGDALKPGAPQLYDNGNVMRGKPFEYERGDIEKGFADADFIIAGTFRTQVAVHNPFEVHCSLVNWDGDQLIVHDSTQAIYRVRDAIADSLGIPESHIRVIKKYMGGGFGSKLTLGKYTVMAALLAKEIGRPVKIVLDRKEMNLAVGNRPDSMQKLKIGVKKDGVLTALSHESYGAAGAYPSDAGCSWPLRSMYQCDNVKVEEYTVYINAGPGRPMRAPGHVQGTFALDSAMDEAAETIDMDPLEFRLKNYAEIDQAAGQPYTSKHLREAYLKGAEAIGWKERWHKPGTSPGPMKRGLGMASQIWWGGGAPPAYATLKLNRDGSLRVISGTQDIGTGTYTILAQVASEVLEIPVDKISVILGDTGTCPYAPASGGSMTAPSVTPAVRDAAELMKAKLISGAAAILEVDETALVYSKGVVSLAADPDTSMGIDKILRQMRERVLVTTGARNRNPEGYSINSFGAQFAEVDVDIGTGLVKVLKVVAAHDIGRTLNRQTLENQFHGGIIQGLSFALMEQRVMDSYTGTVLTTNLHDYKLPTVMDTPEIDVIIVSEGDPMISDVGAKGIGEPAIIPTAAAIANAVYNAIGVRIRTLPMTPDKIIQAINA